MYFKLYCGLIYKNIKITLIINDNYFCKYNEGVIIYYCLLQIYYDYVMCREHDFNFVSMFDILPPIIETDHSQIIFNIKTHH